jgi:hypothetical protein
VGVPPACGGKVPVIPRIVGTKTTTTRGSIYARISKDRDGNTLGVERQQED